MKKHFIYKEPKETECFDENSEELIINEFLIKYKNKQIICHYDYYKEIWYDNYGNIYDKKYIKYWYSLD